MRKLTLISVLLSLCSCSYVVEQVGRSLSENTVSVVPKPKIPNTLRVMVIDTGVDGSIPELRRFIPQRYLETSHAQDTHGHGTHVMGIIANHACTRVEILPCSYYRTNDWGLNNLNRELGCINLATREQVDIVNFSGGGNLESRKEKEYVAKFLKTSPDNLFISAAGNDGSNLDKWPFYPCSYRQKGQVCVGAINRFGKPLVSSNYASWLVWEQGLMVESFLPSGRRGTLSGTSQATAAHTAKKIQEWCEGKK